VQLDEDELLLELSSQNITAVKQIYVTKDGNKKKTNTTFLTFSQTLLPSLSRLDTSISQYSSSTRDHFAVSNVSTLATTKLTANMRLFVHAAGWRSTGRIPAAAH